MHLRSGSATGSQPAIELEVRREPPTDSSTTAIPSLQARQNTLQLPRLATTIGDWIQLLRAPGAPVESGPPFPFRAPPHLRQPSQQNGSLAVPASQCSGAGQRNHSAPPAAV